MLPKTQIFKEEIKLANKPQIDIPLGEPAQILQTEMEIVNRHHEEVREQHRRARVQQEG